MQKTFTRSLLGLWILALVITSCTAKPASTAAATEARQSSTPLPTATAPEDQSQPALAAPGATSTPTSQPPANTPSPTTAPLARTPTAAPVDLKPTATRAPVKPVTPPAGAHDWNMTAGNPQRTSWTADEVTGQLHVEWYRPIEAYIPQNAQLIAAGGLIFVSTSRGLYALSAADGSEVWRYDTALPLGNSPTVVDGTVYVGGYDRKLHALQASDGLPLWSFDGAGAGYSANPLVVDGRVIIGNRDGWMYAIGAQGAPDQGQLIWKFQTGGLIDLSAAYKDGVVYFASNDNFAYALRASDGSLVWKSERLPGDGYQSYWPVIYQDKVIFATASGYRNGAYPGAGSVTDPSGSPYAKIYDIERDDLFGGAANGAANGALIGEPVSGQSWAGGKQVLDASSITNYLEVKPWHRALIALNQSDGREYTFDSDGDGLQEYLPALFWGTHSSNRYPPIVGADGVLYFSNILQRFDIPQGRVMGWLPGLHLLSQAGGQGAVDEPQALSSGGSTLYRSICCDRVGDYFFTDSNRAGSLWNYNNTLSMQIPGYDPMWYGSDPSDSVRLHGNYGTLNGIYNNHGDQNPIIPYGGRLYIHRSNTVIAYGPGAGPLAQPLLTIAKAEMQSAPLIPTDLTARLESEIAKMVAAGHLRPGYYNNGQFNYTQLANYFENPGDTIYTLSIALPYLSPALQSQVRDYLRAELADYFDPVMYARTGWAGAARESMALPPEVEGSMASKGKQTSADKRSTWDYPPFNFYAMWKYAQAFPEDAPHIYDLAKSRLQVPVPPLATDPVLTERPYEANAYIAGYTGILRLQELAGRTADDADLRAAVTSELDRLQTLRAATFTKDTPWVAGRGSYHLRVLNISQNFLWMTPELGDYLNQHALDRVQAALDEYNFTAPYWFVTRYNAAINEGGRQNLYDVPAVFQAKAYILKESRDSLTPYLDVPAFERGDLFYLQNLVAALQAP